MLQALPSGDRFRAVFHSGHFGHSSKEVQVTWL